MRKVLTATNLIGLVILALGAVAYFILRPAGDTLALNDPQKIGVAGTQKVALYFVNSAGKLKAETRSINFAQGENHPNRILQELFKGPSKPELKPLVALGTPTPIGINHQNELVIDLPNNLKSMHLSAQQEMHLIDGIVKTMLGREGITQIRFLVAGQQLSSLGHITLDQMFGEPKAEDTTNP